LTILSSIKKDFLSRMATVEEEESTPMVCGGPQEHRVTGYWSLH